MTYDRAIWLLCQMYLPCFDEEEKEALTLAIYTLEERKEKRKMKLTKEIEITDFLSAIKQAKGAVWLISNEGDKYNLKSTLSRYVAIGALLSEHGDELELFCDNKSDESYFYRFFENHPEVLSE